MDRRTRAAVSLLAAAVLLVSLFVGPAAAAVRSAGAAAGDARGARFPRASALPGTLRALRPARVRPLIVPPDDDIPGVTLPATPVNDTLDDAEENGDWDDVYQVQLQAGDRFTVTLNGPADTEFLMQLFPPVATHVMGEVPPVRMSFPQSEIDMYPQPMSYVAPTTGAYYLDVTTYFGAGAYTLDWQITDGEADDLFPGAALPASPTTGTLDMASDAEDIFSVHLDAGQKITASVMGGLDTGSGLMTDFEPELFPPGTTDLWTEPVTFSAGEGYPEQLSYVVPPGKGGTYSLAALGFFGKGDYTLTWSITDPPKINFVKNTGPIAYDLKSLQTTRFYTSVNTPNVWAELKVKTPKGDKFIYKGAIPEANKNFYFPLWNGRAPDGTKLPSSSYDWVLTVYKGGQSSSMTGKITVSKIYFARSGTLSAAGMTQTQSGYMIPGNANCYLRVTTAQPSSLLKIGVTGPSGYSASVLNRTFTTAGTLNVTSYLRNAAAPRARAMHSFKAQNVKPGVSYVMTVIQ